MAQSDVSFNAVKDEGQYKDTRHLHDLRSRTRCIPTFTVLARQGSGRLTKFRICKGYALQRWHSGLGHAALHVFRAKLLAGMGWKLSDFSPPRAQGRRAWPRCADNKIDGILLKGLWHISARIQVPTTSCGARSSSAGPDGGRISW